MNNKSMTLASLVAAVAAVTLMAGCDKRDNTATPPMPTTSPSTTTPPPPAGTTGSTTMPGDPAASGPAAGASR